MVRCRNWMLLWLAALKSSKASESFVDERSVANAKLDELTQDGIAHLDDEKVTNDPVLISGHELIDEQSSAWPKQRSSDGLPRKRLRTDLYGTTCHSNSIDENPTKKRQRLSEERKADIHRNLAKHEEQISDMRSKGEQMKRWFDFLFENEKFVLEYGRGWNGESISTVLKELKEIRRDINEVAQIRLRKWAGLGGRVFMPEPRIDTERPPEELVIEPTNQVEFTSKVTVQPTIDCTTSSQNLETRQKSMENSSKDHKLEDGDSRGETSDFARSMVGVQDKTKSKFNDSSLEPIYEKLMESRAQDLKVILQSTLWPSETSIGPCEVKRETIKLAKLCFEKSIFQAIQFMYEFSLIDKKTFGSLFSSDYTDVIIGMHLMELFHVVKYGAYQDPMTLIPEMEFLSNQFQTEHLHGIFSVLNQTNQCHLIYAALKFNFQLFKYNVGIKTPSWNPEGIHQRFLDRPLLEYLELKAQVDSDLNVYIVKNHPQVETHIQETIDYFQNPLPTMGGKELKQVEFILNYYVLRFIDKYFNQYLRTLFQSENEYDILSHQLQLVQEGIRAQYLIKQGYFFSSDFLLQMDSKKLCTVSKKTAQQLRPKLHKDFITTSHKFHKLSFQLQKMSKENSQLKNWLKIGTASKDLLDDFHRITCGTWAMELENQRVKREELKEFFQTAQKKLKLHGGPHMGRFVDLFYSQSP